MSIDQKHSSDALPPSDHFSQEISPYAEWLWVGNHPTREDAILAAAQPTDEPGLSVRKIRARIDLRPGELSDCDPFLTPDPDGEYEFWQVRYV